jgi:hypothetical protein
MLAQARALAHNRDMDKKKNPHAVALGRIGGSVSGKCKARTSEQARAAANARWACYREKKLAALAVDL